MWLILILVVLGAAFAWMVRRPDDDVEPEPVRFAADDVDFEELEEAEREVQEAGDPESVRDWGPGAARPREQRQ